MQLQLFTSDKWNTATTNRSCGTNFRTSSQFQGWVKDNRIIQRDFAVYVVKCIREMGCLLGSENEISTEISLSVIMKASLKQIPRKIYSFLEQ